MADLDSLFQEDNQQQKDPSSSLDSLFGKPNQKPSSSLDDLFPEPDANIPPAEPSASQSFSDFVGLNSPAANPVEFTKQIIEESIRTYAINFGEDVAEDTGLIEEGALEQKIGQISNEDQSLLSGTASGLGQATGNLATIGTFAAGGAAVGAFAGGIGAVPGAAIGATIGTGVTVGQGIRRELKDTYTQTREAGGSVGDAIIATAKAAPITVASEFAELIPIYKIIPDKARKALSKGVIGGAAKYIGEGIEKLGKIKGILAAGAVEAVGEGAQQISQQAAVESTLDKNKGFLTTAAKSITTPETAKAALIGGITGSTLRGGIDLGFSVLDNVKQGKQTSIDEATIEIAKAINDIKDPDTDVTKVEIKNADVTIEKLQQIVEGENLKALETEQGLAIEQDQKPDLSKAIEEGTKEFAPNIPSASEEQNVNVEANQNLEYTPPSTKQKLVEQELQTLQDTVSGSQEKIKQLNEEITPLLSKENLSDEEKSTLKVLKEQKSREQQKVKEARADIKEIESTPEDKRLPKAARQYKKIFGISAAGASQFKESQFGHSIVDKKLLNPIAEEAFLKSGYPEYMPTTTSEQLSKANKFIEERGGAEIVAKELSSRTSETDAYSGLTNGEIAFIHGVATDILNKQIDTEVAAGNTEKALELADLVDEFTQSTQPYATTAGQDLWSFGAAQKYLMDTKERALFEVTRIYNEGRLKTPKSILDAEKSVARDSIEVKAEESKFNHQAERIKLEQDNISELETQAQDVSKDISKLDSEIVRDSSDIETAKTTEVPKSISKDLDEYKSQLAKVEEELTPEDKVELSEGEAKVKALEDRIKGIRKRHRALQSSVTRQVNTLSEASIAKRRARLVDLENRVHELNKEKEFLKARIVKNPRLHTLRERRKKLVQKRYQLTKAIEKLPTVEQVVANENLRAAELEREIEVKKARLSANKARLQELQSIIGEKNSSLEAQVKDLNKLAARISKKKQEVLNKENKLRQARTKAKAKIAPESLPKDILDRIQPLLDKFEKVSSTAKDSDFLKADLATQIIHEVSLATDPDYFNLARYAWYVNVLSGVSTQVVNTVSTGANTALNSFSAILANPTSSKAVFTGLLDGAAQGFKDFRNIIAGEPSRATLEKWGLNINEVDALLKADYKSLSSKQKRARLLASALTLKVGDVAIGQKMLSILSASDAFFYRTASEMRSALIADKLIKSGKIKNKDTELPIRISEVLHNSSEEMAAANTQALSEVEAIYGDSLDAKRKNRLAATRAFEILESKRPKELVDEAKNWAEVNVFTNPPVGVMGVVSDLFNQAAYKLDIPSPFGIVRGIRQVLHMFVPFVNVIGNVANTALDYIPIVGLVRSQLPQELVAGEGLVQKRMGQQKEEALKALLGATAAAAFMSALEKAFVPGDEEEQREPWLAIYGQGPSDPQRNAVWRQGGKQFSIKIGDKYIKWHETPLVFVFSPLAAYYDAKRWDKKFDERTSIQTLTMALGSMPKAFAETGFLKSTKELLEFLTGDTRTSGDLALSFIERLKSYSTGFIPLSGFVNSFKPLFDNDVPDAKDSLKAYYLARIPAATDIAGVEPDLNVFGEPIKEERAWILSRYYQKISKDPYFKYLAENDLTISQFPPGYQIGINTSGKNTKYNKRMVEDLLSYRREEFEAIPEWQRFLGRMAFDKLTHAERRELVKIAGPYIKEAVDIVATQHNDKPRAEKQAILDDLVSKAKKKAKLEFLGLR